MSALITVLVDPVFNSQGIVAWVVKNIIPIILLVIGIGIISSARRGQFARNTMTITNVLLGCALIGGAALFYGFGDGLASFIFAR